MTKWRCDVCGFIHDGDQAPEPCPVCGASESYVAAEPVEDAVQPTEAVDAEPAAEAEDGQGAEAPVAPAPEPAAVKKWRCTVCGYIHEGDEPPDVCPVCGADKSMFEPVLASAPEKQSIRTIRPQAAAVDRKKPDAQPRQEKIWPAPESEDNPAERTEPAAQPEADMQPPPAPAATAEPAPQGFYDMVLDQMLKHHVHPVSVHIPNGMLPISFIFMLLTLVTGSTALNMAAFCNMIAVVACMPLVLFSGYIEWQKRYRGYLSNRFITKIVCAAVVAITALASVIWWIVDPDVMMAVSWSRRCFMLINLIMVGAAVTAGYIGGKLVFKD